MKKRLVLGILVLITFFINACSCDKFDFNTYQSAVKNYGNSLGISYDLMVTTIEEGNDVHILEESTNKYLFSTSRTVQKFSSQLKKYEVLTSDTSANSAPNKVYELNRYYVSSTTKFYKHEKTLNTDIKEATSITYENMYAENSSSSNINNILPVFEEDSISNFNIEESSKKEKYSIATFMAECPAFESCNEEKISYTITMDENFFLNKIEFEVKITIEEKLITRKYVYEIKGYGEEIELVFPDDLANY